LHFENISDLESILEKASDVLADLTHYTSIVSSLSRDDKFYFNGLHFLLELPEFNDIAKLRLFLSILEERKRLLELINNAPQGSINIYIGKESHCDEIEECSLLVTTFSNKGSSHGHLGIIGPKRMNYSRVIAILEYLSQELSDLLSEC
jgi:heat-inducible transcriptional repressor